MDRFQCDDKGPNCADEALSEMTEEDAETAFRVIVEWQKKVV